jgi:hypothetical protein
MLSEMKHDRPGGWPPACAAVRMRPEVAPTYVHVCAWAKGGWANRGELLRDVRKSGSTLRAE